MTRPACQVGTLSESHMDPKPFIRLAEPRVVNRPELPPDLAEFYTWHEGIGLESPPDRTVRLCRLDEVACVGWKELVLVGDVPEGWEPFAAFRVGMGRFFEELLYVLEAPSCSSGSILAIGGMVPGPGGEGPASLETSLVLARRFQDWLTHLEQCGWVEYAVAGIRSVPEREQQELCRYYLALNPGMNLCSPE
jgi:hypothetical protein